MHCMDTRALIERLGGDEAVMAALDVKQSAINTTRREGLMPARWFVPLRDMGQAKGVFVPETLFRWRERKGAA